MLNSSGNIITFNQRGINGRRRYFTNGTYVNGGTATSATSLGGLTPPTAGVVTISCEAWSYTTVNIVNQCVIVSQDGLWTDNVYQELWTPGINNCVGASGKNMDVPLNTTQTFTYNNTSSGTNIQSTVLLLAYEEDV